MEAMEATETLTQQASDLDMGVKIVCFKTRKCDDDNNNKLVKFTARRKSKTPRVYKDNTKNRTLNRVGQEIKMHPNMMKWTEKVRKGEISRDNKGRILKNTIT